MLKNLGTTDRVLRITVGLGLVVAAVAGWVGSWGWLGLLPLLSGLVGTCPAYLPFGLSTCARRSGPPAR